MSESTYPELRLSGAEAVQREAYIFNEATLFVISQRCVLGLTVMALVGYVFPTVCLMVLLSLVPIWATIVNSLVFVPWGSKARAFVVETIFMLFVVARYVLLYAATAAILYGLVGLVGSRPRIESFSEFFALYSSWKVYDKHASFLGPASGIFAIFVGVVWARQLLPVLVHRALTFPQAYQTQDKVKRTFDDQDQAGKRWMAPVYLFSSRATRTKASTSPLPVERS